MFKKVFAYLIVVFLISSEGHAQVRDSLYEPNKDTAIIRPYFSGKLFIDTDEVQFKFPLSPLSVKALKSQNSKRGYKKYKVNIDIANFKQKVYIDTSVAVFLSSLLYRFKEPSLPLNDTEIFYRFTWLRSLNGGIIIKLFEKNHKLFIETKWLTHPLIDISELPYSRLVEFQTIVDELGFWKMKSVQATILGTDGSSWLIEGQKGTKYHFTYRDNGGEISKIGVWLIKNSNAAGERIY